MLNNDSKSTTEDSNEFEYDELNRLKKINKNSILLNCALNFFASVFAIIMFFVIDWNSIKTLENGSNLSGILIAVLVTLLITSIGFGVFFLFAYKKNFSKWLVGFMFLLNICTGMLLAIIPVSIIIKNSKELKQEQKSKDYLEGIAKVILFDEEHDIIIKCRPDGSVILLDGEEMRSDVENPEQFFIDASNIETVTFVDPTKKDFGTIAFVFTDEIKSSLGLSTTTVAGSALYAKTTSVQDYFTLLDLYQRWSNTGLIKMLRVRN